MHGKDTVRRIVFTAMFAALACVATMIIKIPSPLNGYLNLGDCIVLLAGWMLPPVYGFLAAGIGSALADIFSGYFVYAPITFVVKGLMALVAIFLFKALCKNIGNLPSRIVSGVAAELIMVSGYYVFEGFMCGFGPSVANIPANCVQGLAGVVFGCVLVKVLEKTKISFS